MDVLTEQSKMLRVDGQNLNWTHQRPNMNGTKGRNWTLLKYESGRPEGLKVRLLEIKADGQ